MTSSSLTFDKDTKVVGRCICQVHSLTKLQCSRNVAKSKTCQELSIVIRKKSIFLFNNHSVHWTLSKLRRECRFQKGHTISKAFFILLRVLEIVETASKPDNFSFSVLSLKIIIIYYYCQLLSSSYRH